MRKMLAGERKLTPAQFSLSVVTILIGVAVLLFVADARSTAKQSQKVAQHAINTERAILETIVGACETRLVTDGLVLDLAKAVHDFGKALDDVTKQAELPPGLTPQMIKNYQAQVRAITALDTGTAELAERQLINNCPKYKVLLASLPPGSDTGNGG